MIGEPEESMSVRLHEQSVESLRRVEGRASAEAKVGTAMER